MTIEAESIFIEPGVVGIISDMHGNLTALDAVIVDGEAAGVTRWLVLGDIVAMGPQPSAVIDRLSELDVIATISGNTERYVLTDDRPPPTFQQVIDDPEKLPTLVEVAATFAWTRGFLAASGRLGELESYRSHARLSLPDGTTLLATHASLRSDEGVGIHPELSVEQCHDLFPDPRADIVLGGHTHEPTDLVIGEVRFLNPGSVSNHHRGNPAQYATLTIEADSHRFEMRTADYDKQSTVAAIEASTIPGAAFLYRAYFDDVMP